MKENICNINHKKNSLKIELNDLKAKPRDYKCPCGKAYLSYAALFTHIKQKHNGKVYIYIILSIGTRLDLKTNQV